MNQQKNTTESRRAATVVTDGPSQDMGNVRTVPIPDVHEDGAESIKVCFESGNNSVSQRYNPFMIDRRKISLEYGRQFVSQEPTAEQIQFLNTAFCGDRFRIQRCWFNSQSVMIYRPDVTRLEYAEGIVVVDGFTIDHAWLVLDGEIVVDPTLRIAHQRSKGLKVLRGRVIGRIPPSCSYTGIIVSRDDLKQAWMELRRYDSLLWSQHIAQRYFPIPNDERG